MLHVIAEAATNHNGKLEAGRKLVDIAKEAGADSVKFQLIYPEGLYLEELWQDGKRVPNDVVVKRRAAMLPDDDVRRLADYAAEKGIPWTTSIFDVRGLDLAEKLKVPYIKIASTDLNNLPLLKRAAERKRKLVVSTGMSTLGEVEKAVAAITSTGHRDLVLLHCVSVYPCPTEKANLRFMTTLKQAFGFPVGFSDHTDNPVAAVAAVALGAEWIEKHYTYDRKAEGFDHANSMDGPQFARYVADLRAAVGALEVRVPKVGETEEGVRKRARRSLYAARDLAAGEVVKEVDVLIVRPEGPLAPGDVGLILGRTLAKAVRKYEILTLESFGLR